MRSRGVTKNAALYLVAADAVGGHSQLPCLKAAKEAGAKLNALASKLASKFGGLNQSSWGVSRLTF